jgi:glycosyltransferase involved in cell wall biosynthesis
MSKPGRRIILFYKALICPGGAERLLAKEYQYLTALGYEVFVVTYRLDPSALFGVVVPPQSLIILERAGLGAILRLAQAIRELGNPPVLCSSGHPDIFLSSLIGGFQYALHIHHPCYMSFNDFDKYSMLMQRHFEPYTRSNFGAARFVEIRDSFSVWKKIDINLRALLSIGAKRRSLCNFVLSRLAQREKRDLYGIGAEVLCGALDDDFRITGEGRVRQQDATTPYRLLTVARLDINKRIDEMIRAVALLNADGVPVHLRVAGSGPEREPLRALIDELGLVGKVELLGFVPDEKLSEIYADSDLFVSIDWADYKITLFEALTKCLPVLVSDESECDDRLVDLGYIRAVQPKPELVAAAIKAFMQHPVAVLPGRVAPILQDYTWGRYFQKIAQSLARAGLIAPPRDVADHQNGATPSLTGAGQ